MLHDSVLHKFTIYIHIDTDTQLLNAQFTAYVLRWHKKTPIGLKFW